MNPTGAFDSHSRSCFSASLQNIHTQLGAAILMVTHDAFAASYAQRILVLRDGAIFYGAAERCRKPQTVLIKILNVLGNDGEWQEQ